MNEWFEDRFGRVSTCHHIDGVPWRGVRVVVAVEDRLYRDTSVVPRPGEAVLHYGVLNNTHRDFSVVFRARMEHDALGFRDSNECLIVAYRHLDRKAVAPPFEGVLRVYSRQDSGAPQEVIISEASLPVSMALAGSAGSAGRARGLPPLRAVVSIREELSATRVDDNLEGKMRYLRALGKAVSKAAGPLAAPLEFLMLLYEDEQAEDREKQLQAIVDAPESVQRESLAAVLEEKAGMKGTRESLLDMSLASVRSMQRRAQNRGEIEREDLVATQVQETAITELDVRTDLEHLFTDIDAFVEIVRRADFPVTRMKVHGVAPFVLFGSFVDSCRGQAPAVLCGTFKALSQEKPGARRLARLAQAYCELSASSPR